MRCSSTPAGPDALWSGGPQEGDRPDAAKYLPEIRQLLLDGKNAEAEALVYKNFTANGVGSARGRGQEIEQLPPSTISA